MKLRFVLWAGFGRDLYRCLTTEVVSETPKTAYDYTKLVKPNAKKTAKSNKPSKEES